MRTPSPWVLPDRPTLLQNLVESGISKRRVRGAVRDGRLLRIRHGVYLGVNSWPIDFGEQHVLRAWAEQLVKPDSAVSHRSAAVCWGLPLPHEDWEVEPVWLTRPAGPTRRSERGTRLRQSIADLPAAHVTTFQRGFGVTTLPRTAVDVSRGLGLPEALLVLDAALRRQCSGLVVRASRTELANPRLVAVARESFMEAVTAMPGTDQVRVALGIANPLRESPIESLSYGHMVNAGLPLPACQVPIRTKYGLVFPDFFWEGPGVVGESDGRVKYVDSGATMREKEREQALRDLDLRVVRWSGKEIHLEPWTVMARIERELGSRSGDAAKGAVWGSAGSVRQARAAKGT